MTENWEHKTFPSVSLIGQSRYMPQKFICRIIISFYLVSCTHAVLLIKALIHHCTLWRAHRVTHTHTRHVRIIHHIIKAAPHPQTELRAATLFRQAAGIYNKTYIKTHKSDISSSPLRYKAAANSDREHFTSMFSFFSHKPLYFTHLSFYPLLFIFFVGSKQVCACTEPTGRGRGNDVTVCWAKTTTYSCIHKAAWEPKEFSKCPMLRPRYASNKVSAGSSQSIWTLLSKCGIVNLHPT